MTSSEVDHLSLSSFQRCRLILRRHRFASAFVGIAMLVTCALGLWSRSSPRLSFVILQIGILKDLPRFMNATCDQQALSAQVTDQLSPIFLKSISGQKADAVLPPQAVATQQIMIKTLQATLPLFLKSAKDNSPLHSSTTSDATKMLIPALLAIPPQNWEQWQTQIMDGHFKFGDCRFLDQRAACEVTIYGPQDKSASIALLWEKSSLLLWQLKGIIGLDLLIAAMK